MTLEEELRKMTTPQLLDLAACVQAELDSRRPASPVEELRATVFPHLNR